MPVHNMLAHRGASPATDLIRFGRGALTTTRVGFGTASIGGLYEPVPAGDAARVLDHAWERGIRSFDTAPAYGEGLAEERLGATLTRRPRDEFMVSTKVGYLVAPLRPAFDRDSIRRSLDTSLARLGLDRIDVVYIHDPDAHWQEAVDAAYPALDALRSEGVIRAIGVGMNQAPMLERFVRETDIDVVLCAGRYTLLDQSALPDLLPVAIERQVAVIVGGVMNSGLLADPRPGARYDYREASPQVLERARAIRAITTRWGVALTHAAAQFPLRHPAVTGILTGVREPAHLDDIIDGVAAPAPEGMWQELEALAEHEPGL